MRERILQCHESAAAGKQVSLLEVLSNSVLHSVSVFAGRMKRNDWAISPEASKSPRRPSDRCGQQSGEKCRTSGARGEVESSSHSSRTSYTKSPTDHTGFVIAIRSSLSMFLPLTTAF
jgi:hypothetical protein